MQLSSIRPVPASAGIGLRSPHFREILDTLPDISWFEVHSENFFAAGGMSLHVLHKIREHYPLSLHGVGLSLGSASPLDSHHLQSLKSLVDRVQPALVSEHVSWSQVDGLYLNDLLPIPYTEESLSALVRNIDQLQDILQRQILIENPSTYLSFRDSAVPEWQFLNEVARRSGCGILLDVNNIYVSAQNNGFSAEDYLQQIDIPVVKEIHLAGHEHRPVGEAELLIDTHSRPVKEAVWVLYAQAIARFGRVPTLIEWDTDIPALQILQEEAAKAQVILDAKGECHAAA